MIRFLFLILISKTVNLFKVVPKRFLDDQGNPDIIVLFPRRPHFHFNMLIVIKIRNNMIMEANEMKKSFISIICNTKKSEYVVDTASEHGFLLPRWKKFFMLHFKLHTFIFICFPTYGDLLKARQLQLFFFKVNCVWNIFTVFFDYFWHTISKLF